MLTARPDLKESQRQTANELCHKRGFGQFGLIRSLASAVFLTSVLTVLPGCQSNRLEKKLKCKWGSIRCAGFREMEDRGAAQGT